MTSRTRGSSPAVVYWRMSPFTTWAALLMGAAVAAPESANMSEPRAKVTIEGKTRPVRRATLGVRVTSEVWDSDARASRYGPEHAEASYFLEVDVDEHSGEDGAPAPQVQSIPVRRAAGGRHPSLAQLATLDVHEADDGYDCDEWDAWLGNDAPGLCGNHVTFQGWEGDALRVRWEAHYDDGPHRRPFLFEGLVEFTGVYVKVRDAAEADVFLERAWGGQPVATLEKHVLGWSDHGPTFAADRRFTYAVVYARKGQPLSDSYRVGSPTKEAATAEAEARRARFAAAAAKPQGVAPAPAPPPAADAGPARRLFDGGQRFSLMVPGDWTAVPEAEDPVMARLGGITLRRGSGDAAETLKAVWVEMLIADDLAEYVDTSLGAYASIWRLEERAVVELSGHEGQRLVMVQTVGAATARLLKYFVSAGGQQVIVMTLAAPPGSFGARLAGYEAIARSLEIAPPR